jgi:DNA polymerase III delta prime subunit
MNFSAHHAYLIRGSLESNLSSYTEDSEVYECVREKFGVADAREVSVIAHQTPTTHRHRTIVIRSSFLTLEAQNALLKVLEEPPASSRFILLVPPDMTVLETILSRVEEFLIDTVDEHPEFVVFLRSAYKERVSAIETAQKKKDVTWQRKIKEGLIAYLASQTSHGANLSELEFVSRLLLTRGASNKMLLEHLALNLPTRS